LFLDIQDFNATAIYMKFMSPITNGIEGRISFISKGNEKSAGSNIHLQNYQFILISFIITVLFFNIETLI